MKREVKDNRSAANRAEEVRGRRAQRSQQRVSSASSRIVNPIQPRPVIVRGSSFGTPIHRQAGTRARRQFYVTMNQAAGTELRLPAIPLVNPGWRLISGLLAIIMIVGIYAMMNSSMFQVASVDVQGLKRLSVDELTSTLDLENLSIITVDVSEVEGKITSKFPELTNVQVEVKMPNVVTVNAGERTPVLAIQKGEKTQWVDADGVVFKARGDAGPLVTIQAEDNLPAAPAPLDTTNEDAVIANTGADAAGETNSTGSTKDASAKESSDSKGKTKTAAAIYKVDPVIITAVQALSKKVPAKAKLIYSKEDGLGWNDPQGWKVYIGRDLSDFEAKYMMYQRLSSYLAEQGIKPSLISVEHLSAPFYRLEQ